jgi:two-component system response regulator FixJ
VPEETVHVVDDDEAVCHSLALLLESAGLRVETHGSSVAFLRSAASLRGGCVLMDVRMPGMDGLELQRRLAEAGVRLPIIIMTAYGDVPAAVRALKAGAVDFIEKPFDDEVLLAAVHAALQRGAEDRRAEAERAKLIARLESLTPRERTVLDGLIVGHPNKTIAYDLGISPRTVEVHRARIMEKMGARSPSDLVRLAFAAGLIPPTSAPGQEAREP